MRIQCGMRISDCGLQTVGLRECGFRIPHSGPRTCRAFTMVEIAISLAIIAFAMVAIIGVLPIGMNTQRDNREETIINQDAALLLDAIRNGARGLDYLTNYVVAITNHVVEYDQHMAVVSSWINWYTLTGSSTTPEFPLTNGLRIVGLLSTPKYMLPSGGRWGHSGFLSNRVNAYVRSLSGPASEKFPQDNRDVQDFALSYRLTSEVVPYWTNHVDPAWIVSPADLAIANNLQDNLHDVRLLFRWPLRSRGQLGQGSQSFRTTVGGRLVQTNDIGHPLYFFEPRNYVKTP